MSGLPPASWTHEPASPTAAAPQYLTGTLLRYRHPELTFVQGILLSIGAHIAVVGLIALFFYILLLLGLSLVNFNRPEQTHDIEFQLVQAPTEKPRNPNTRNRAEHNTRAGGQKVPNMHEAQTITQAGQPHHTKPLPPSPPKPSAHQPHIEQPVVHHTQSHVQPAPKAPTEAQNHAPAAPHPRVTAPHPTTSHQHISALPNPLAPIHAPAAPAAASSSGPVVRGPYAGSTSGGSGSGSSSSTPAMMPGQFTHGGAPGGGGAQSGQGGRGAYSQYGSPGGGGGRAGIDALAEPDFGPYIAELQRRIRHNWTPPDDRQDKTVVVLFTIARDGRLLGITMKRSSGYADADSAARAAVERSAPFRRLPPEFRGNEVSVEFTFDYNVFTGRSSGIHR